MTLAEEVSAIPFWWHSIDLGDGTVTPGQKTADLLGNEWKQLALPNLEGKTVLDIGAWDGWFSFQAERCGAKRVVALEPYAWDGVGRPISRDGFDLAHSVLGSSVELVTEDFMTTDLTALGTFDIVFFLGVLYHLRDPLRGLERLASVTEGTAYIESQAVVIGGHPDLSACEFYEDDRLDNNPTNWWAPTSSALAGMCRSMGFADNRVLVGPPPGVIAPEVRGYRCVLRASRFSQTD